MNYNIFFDEAVNSLKTEGRYRVFADLERMAGQFPRALYRNDAGQQKEVTIWCSNDYLGMGQNKLVMQAMHEAIENCGAGAGGTRNISGTTRYIVDLERSLCGLHGKEAALVFSSGYVSNEASISTIAKLMPGCVIFSDEKNHASMIHGIKSSGMAKKIFRHNDVEHLEQLLRETPYNVPKLIVFESVYSMDGTISPIAEICALAKRYNAMTYLDEVHAVGVYGSNGGGVAQLRGLCDEVDIIEGTFGKAYGLMGGFITGNKNIIDCVRSYASEFIFTTALPPAVLAGALASVEYLKTSQLERERHKHNTDLLKSMLDKAGLPWMRNDSHIVPLMVGDSVCCKAITDWLLDTHNIYVQPINYPTVPKGTERMRLTATAAHNETQIRQLVSALTALYEHGHGFDTLKMRA